MERLNVNPTRMELTKLKARLKTAQRGHKLLKDKRDELMKQFLDIVKKNRELRIEVEKSIMKVYGSFTVASAVMSPEIIEESLMTPKQGITVGKTNRNIMSVNVPQFTFEMTGSQSDIYPYGFAFTSGELDNAINAVSDILPTLLELAQIEKTVQLLADEIEKTRRRVNALEYVLIPQLEMTIRYIAMKLEENERGNLTRLMKVKDMMLEEQLEASRNEKERKLREKEAVLTL